MANPFTEKERLKIVYLVEINGKHWKFIAENIPGRSDSTIKSFYKSYEIHGTIFPKLGRPVKITQEIKDDVVKSIEDDPEQHLNDLSSKFDISTTSTKKGLNTNGISYHEKIPITPLKPQHIEARLNMCDRFLIFDYKSLWPIIFTDESTVIVDLKKGGAWRRRGYYPPHAFYSVFKKTISIMV